MKETKDLKNRLIEIEKNLIEQEHRPIQVITNYLFRKKKWPNEGDERRLSSKKAIIWRLFFSPGVVAATGGVIALASICVLVWQTSILQDQNGIIEEQNIFFRQQILSDDIRSSKSILLSKDSLNNSVVAEALIEFITSKKAIQATKNEIIKVTGVRLLNYSFSDEPSLFENVEFIDSNFRGTSFNNVNFTKTKFINCEFQGNIQNIYKMYYSGIPRFQKPMYMPTIFNKCFFKGVESINTSFNGSIFNDCDLSGLNFVSDVSTRFTTVIKKDPTNRVPNLLASKNLNNFVFTSKKEAFEKLNNVGKEIRLKTIEKYNNTNDLLEFTLPAHDPSIIIEKKDYQAIMRIFTNPDLTNFLDDLGKVEIDRNHNWFITWIYHELDKSEIFITNSERIKFMPEN